MISGQLLLLSAVLWLSQAHAPKCTLSILSLLSYPDQNPAFNPRYTDGPDIVPAGYLALEMINNRSDILSNYRVELVEARGGCGGGTLTLSEKAIVQNIFGGGKRVVGIVGPRCYDSAERVGHLIAKDAIALANVHFSSSPTLGTPSIYPYSTSTTPSVMRFVDAYIALIIRNEWENAHVAFLFEDDKPSHFILEYLTERLNVSGVVYSSIVTDNYIHEALLGLEASSARLVLVDLDSVLTQKLMCVALKRNAIYPKYQWTFLQVKSIFDDITFVYMGIQYSCNGKDFTAALNNSIAFNFSYMPRNGVIMQRGVSGLTYAEYEAKYSEAIRRYNSGIYGTPAKIAKASRLGNPFHDSIWVLALALNSTDAKLKVMNRSLCEYGYRQPDVTKMVQEEILKVRFLGAGGEVNYTYKTKTRSPPGVVNLWMYGDYSKFSSLVKLGCFDDLESLSIVLKNASFIKIIKENRQIRLRFDYFFQSASILALLLTASIHVLNVVHRSQSVVKASSHRLNHAAYVGSYLLIATTMALSTTEANDFTSSAKGILCNLMPWMASIGFALVYGTVLVKLYRLYSLLIVSVRRFKLPSADDTKILSDKNLLFVIVTLTIPAVIVCTVWMIMDPVKVTTTSKLDLSAMQPTMITFGSCLIRSTSKPLLWVGLLTGYTCLLASMVAIAAFLTRSISIQNYKTDNIVILSALLFMLCGIILPIYFFEGTTYTDPEDAHMYLFLMMSFFLIIFIYLCVLLLFIPPVYPLLKKRFLVWTRHLKH